MNTKQMIGAVGGIAVIGAVGAIAGVAGAYAIGARSGDGPRSTVRGRVFWVLGERSATHTGEETVVLDGPALDVLAPVIEPFAQREYGMGYALAGVPINIGHRNHDDGPDAFGEKSFVIEALPGVGPRDARQRSEQTRLTLYLRDLILLGVLDEGGWFARWPRRLEGGGFSQVPVMRFKG